MANCMQAVIGIGSNMGDRLKNINGAVRSLSRLPKTKITACSHIYETRPVGYEAQPLFYNAAIIVETELSAQMLLGACLGIEGAYGRAFVMVPLLDLFPSGRAPGLFFLPALHEIGTDGVERINEEITLPE